MKIKTNTNIPDSTYFTMSQVSPELTDENTLMIWNGKGSRRGWGTPEVTSSVIVKTATFVAVHCGFHHKHRGSQGWFYYLKGENGWQYQTWNQLSDKRRQQVLNAKAPGWAKTPGKLRCEVKRPEVEKITVYKAVEVRENGAMVSLYDGATPYTLGKTLREKAQAGHNGGFYAYRDLTELKRHLANHRIVSKDRWSGVQKVAILKAEAWGKRVIYDNGKSASTYLRPIEVLEMVEVEKD